MEGVYRDEKYIDCKKGRGYKVYVRLWCKSLLMRRIILKVKWTFIRGGSFLQKNIKGIDKKKNLLYNKPRTVGAN